MKTKSPIPKLAGIYPRKNPPFIICELKPIKISHPAVSLVFNRIEEPVNATPLIFAEIGGEYYYLKLSSGFNKFGRCRRSYEGEVFLELGRNGTGLKDWSYVDTTQIFCMGQTEMEQLIDPKPYFLNETPKISNEDKLEVLNELWKHFERGYYSIIDVEYDETREEIIPDLVHCHQKIWKEDVIFRNLKSQNPKEYQRLKLKLECHDLDDFEGHEAEKSSRISETCIWFVDRIIKNQIAGLISLGIKSRSEKAKEEWIRRQAIGERNLQPENLPPQPQKEAKKGVAAGQES